LSASPELAELHNLIGGIRRSVHALKARYGDNPATRRLSDIQLLDTDVAELDLARANVHQSGDKIVIPDTEYDRDFWRDVDDEGVGGHSR
jgi:hypothetical protein